MKNLLLLGVLFLTSAAFGQQTWWKVASEGTSVSVTLPAATTYRLGNGTDKKWSPNETVTDITTFNPMTYNNGLFPFSDPDAGVIKELDILRTSVAQTVTVNGKPVIVPATTVVTPPPAPTATALATVTYTITVNADGSYNSGTCVVSPITAPKIKNPITEP
jgi:hypothetical protein